MTFYGGFLCFYDFFYGGFHCFYDFFYGSFHCFYDFFMEVFIVSMTFFMEGFTVSMTFLWRVSLFLWLFLWKFSLFLWLFYGGFHCFYDFFMEVFIVSMTFLWRFSLFLIISEPKSLEGIILILGQMSSLWSMLCFWGKSMNTEDITLTFLPDNSSSSESSVNVISLKVEVSVIVVSSPISLVPEANLGWFPAVIPASVCLVWGWEPVHKCILVW